MIDSVNIIELSHTHQMYIEGRLFSSGDYISHIDKDIDEDYVNIDLYRMQCYGFDIIVYFDTLYDLGPLMSSEYLITFRAIQDTNTVITNCYDNHIYITQDSISFMYYPSVLKEYTLNNQLDISTYPNPCIKTTTLTYILEKPSYVTIRIFNSHGQQIDEIVHDQPKGQQRVQWCAEGLPAGVYYYRIHTGAQAGNGKIILMK